MRKLFQKIASRNAAVGLGRTEMLTSMNASARGVSIDMKNTDGDNYFVVGKSEVDGPDVAG
jgi:hypothetical protein